MLWSRAAESTQRVYIATSPISVTEVLHLLHEHGCRLFQIHQVDPRCLGPCEKMLNHRAFDPDTVWIEAGLTGEADAQVLFLLETQFGGGTVVVRAPSDADPDQGSWT